MYADAGETDIDCMLSGSDASIPLFSISTEGTVSGQESGVPTQLTPQQSQDAGVMTAGLKCISPEIRQQLQDDSVIDRRLCASFHSRVESRVVYLEVTPCSLTSHVPR